MSNEVVQYKNQLNSVSLTNFTPIEQDLFMVMCSKVKEKHSEELIFNFDDLRALTNYTATSTDTFIKKLKSTNTKLQALNVNFDDGNEYVSFVLFPTYKINRKEQTLKIRVNEEFAFLLNNLTNGGWTGFELATHASLKSGYAKTMFRLLKQWRRKGEAKWDIEQFKILLDIPKSYGMIDIDRRVLKPIEEELSDVFIDLKIKKIKRGRGSKVVALLFTFQPEKKKNKANSELALTDDEEYDYDKLERKLEEKQWANNQK